MVKRMEKPIKVWMIWGETPYFRKHPYELKLQLEELSTAHDEVLVS